MSERASMQPIGKWRAYFAPVDRAMGSVTAFDPSADFDLVLPPRPWTDLGWIRNFERNGSNELQRIDTGLTGLTSLRFRKHCEAKVALDFCEWGKLQMALSASSQHVNLLAGSSFGLNNHDANSLQMSADALAAFAVGDLVAVDVDLTTQSGFVGTGVAGALVKDAAKLGSDYIRATTFNVAKVKQKSPTSLILESPLIGGAPLSGAKVQKVVGFADREGASFLQEWSGLFILEEVSGGRVILWYPRLQTAAESGETRAVVEGDAEQMALHAKFVAMPVRDNLDGETVVSYRYYVPSKAAPAY